MSVEDRLRSARSAMADAAREQDEQRGLRDRRLAEAREQASSSFQREISAAVKYAEHMDELNKRKKDAGGWVTEKTLTDRDSTLAIGVHEDEHAPITPPVQPRGRHARRDSPVEDEDDYSATNWLG